MGRGGAVAARMGCLGEKKERGVRNCCGGSYALIEPTGSALTEERESAT